MTTTTPEAEAEKKAVESPAEQENQSFGTWLRQQRELREISLREIADTSKISLRYLQALEDDRFDILPAPVFAKGFLRQYARYVGLDPEEAINFYMAANGLAQEDDTVDQASQHTTTNTPWSYAMFVIVIAAVLMAVIWTLSWFNRRADTGPVPGKTGGSSATVDGETTTGPETTTGLETTTGPETATFEPPSSTPRPLTAEPSTTDATLAAPSPGFVVTLDFRGDCWVRATVDGETREDRVYTQGESLPLEALQVVDLELGNTFKVDVEVNGHPMNLVNQPDKPNQRVSIDLEMVAALIQGGD